MVRFFIEGLEIFFPYDYVYPEQYEYMRQLKMTLDAKGNCVLEMPTGTGKTVTLLSFIISYQLAHPETGKLIYCTRTVPEMEKALLELKLVTDYLLKELLNETDSRRYKHAQRLLGIGMSARRNLCIHPEVSQQANRDKVDELCQSLIAPWIRLKRKELDKDSKKNILIDYRTTNRSLESFLYKSSIGKDFCKNEDLSNNNEIPPSQENSNKNFSEQNNTSVNDIVKEENPNTTAINIENSANSCGDCTQSSSCEFYENLEKYWSPSDIPSGIYTLNDMKIYGSNFIKEYDKSKAPICPYFASRRLIQLANVIVLNYQYILDPKVSQVAFFGGISLTGSMTMMDQKNAEAELGKDPSVVVFDEAHNIDNVCIEAFSINISMVTLDRARQNLAKLNTLVNEAKKINSQRLLEEYTNLVNSLRVSGQLDDFAVESLANPVIPEDIVKEAIPGNIRRAEFFLATMRHLVLYLSTYIKSLLLTLEVTSLEEYSPLILCANFFTLVGTYWEGFILITDPYPEAEGIYSPLIQLNCLDASIAMKPVLKKFQSVILTSATISPLNLYPKLLKFTPITTMSLPMSLDRNCICPLIVSKGADQIPLTSRFDMRSDQAVLRNYGTLLIELSKTVPDGIVCFFTSYAFMENIVFSWYEMGIIAEAMKHKLILMETKDVIATTLALHSYRKACDSGRGAVFFSIARGKVAEGIDFDRHYGRAVVLFGIPYQFTLSKTLKSRLDYMKAAQCVGRVIRSKADYGLMIFADARYSRVDKRQKLPEWILKHLDPNHMNLSTDAAISIARSFLMEMSQPLKITNKSRLDANALKLLEEQFQKKKSELNEDMKDPSGTQPTFSAHPARFSLDDKYSYQRITCKKRFNLLPTQQPLYEL